MIELKTEGLLGEYIKGLGFTVVPLYLIADENSVIDEEKLFATGVAVILAPIIRVHEIYESKILAPIVTALAQVPGIGTTSGAAHYLPSNTALFVTLLLNGAVTTFAQKLVADENEVIKIIGALLGIATTMTTWKVFLYTLNKETTALPLTGEGA